MEEILSSYYRNNASKLRGLVNKILFKYGGVEQKDYDDFYSLANEVFADVLKRYDAEKDFDAFLYSCLENKIKTEFTRRNRQKRKAEYMSISLETPIDEDGVSTVGDILASDFDINKELGDEIGLSTDERMEEYLKKLSKKQRIIALYLSEGYKNFEIRELLHITEKEYTDSMRAIRSYKYIRILMK